MGGTITALEIQQRNKERVNVYLDSTFAFGLAVLEAARLRKGQYLTDGEIAALKAQDVVEKAYERAVRYLAQRPRSTEEIRRHLTDKGPNKGADKDVDQEADKDRDASVVEEAITRLEAQGYLDDVAFARYWIANRQQFRPRGARALRFELREKGVPSGVIDEVLADFEAGDSAYQAALEKARRFRGLDKRAFRDKLGSYLTRRGYDYGTIRETIDRLISEFEDEGSDALAPSSTDMDDTEE